ncbi:unnamed protein product [Phytophthora fragariaefolia]|uniref:Unnamed protein product n=1 Tax=Phytophthora fragariaefolia TaxID=1490495 RepID=A0A9W6XN52_9STRA|nr:unnamed protein product [Phytophthora fragariaefolia]
MMLGPSGAAALQSRKDEPGTSMMPSPGQRQTVSSPMQPFFSTAMERFPKGQQQALSKPPVATREPLDANLSGAQSVDMKSVRFTQSYLGEYDPDDLNAGLPARAAVTSAELSGAGTAQATTIGVSVISDLKEGIIW